MSGELEALAARVEAAAGPDREIDEAIAKFIGSNHRTGPIHPRISPQGYYAGPAYTASLDAAMTLAKPDWWLRLGGPLSEDAYGWSRMEDRVFRAGFDMVGAPYSAGAIGKTLPLALTAACLKARASLAREPGEGANG